MKRNNLLFALILFTSSQTIAQQLVGSAGGASKISNTALSWSVGEAVTGVASHANQSLVIGLQQPTELMVTSVSGALEHTIQVYPNPACDRLFIERPNGAGLLRLRVYDIHGKTINETDFKTGEDKLELPTEDWNAGVYILRGFHGRELMFETKVIKL